jgi:zinc D-Ala-D-Ala carboxypeptidase
MQLSEHFSLDELTFSQIALRKGIDNSPDAVTIDNLRNLCVTLLEPIRSLLGVALHVDSGYRSQMVNTLVGGATNSAHLSGRAADTLPIGMDLHEAFYKIKATDLPFDQVIIECDAWIHIALPATGINPRRQTMTASGGPGHWVYNYV